MVPTGLLVLAALILGVATILTSQPLIPESLVTNRPIQVSTDGFVSSSACQACHPSEYDTWHGSYHRTMTQVATAETVLADFDGVEVAEAHGDPMQLTRRGREFWAEFNDPGAPGPESTRPRITRQVVMITGSHHQQIYWYATGHDRALNVLPGVFLIDAQRWVPRSAVLLHPPNQSVSMIDGHWNAVCVACHTTLPRTRFDTPFLSEPIDEQQIDTTTAEFGIACEACHGPAEEHIQAHQNPLNRYRVHLDELDDQDDQPDQTIVQPALLDPQRSSQVCGQCHSVWEFYDIDGERAANEHGLRYRPGDELRDTRFLPQPTEQRDSPLLAALVEEDPAWVIGSFWSDGIIRVSGREYSALQDSPCYKDAVDADRTMSCFSCHTLHKSPDDPRSVKEWATTHQVSPGMNGNAACLQCHESLRTNTAAHTRHETGSAGSACYNCHMPYTSYGLLRAIRSHTISSPSVIETVETGRPNACNLCHLDKTLAWTGTTLRDWYGTPTPALTDEEQTVATGLLWAMKGDAGQRALTAWSLGWSPAQAASGTSWMVPHLAELLNDPYEAVRFIAYRSVRTLPGYETFRYDYLDDRPARVAATLPLLQTWQQSRQSYRRRDPELLVDDDGEIRVDAFRRILNQRDNRSLFLRE